MRRFVLISVVTVGLAGCTKNEDATDAEEAQGSEELAQPTEPTGEDVPEPALTEVQLEDRAYVTSISSLRKLPTEDRRIDDPADKSKKKVSNWVATLYRGEEVVILELDGDWARLKASDESEGWMNKKYLVRADDVEMATITEEVQVFRRPDLLALNASKKLDPGSLLYVKRNKDQFAEVNYTSNLDAWILSEKLLKDPVEVSAAKLIAKIRYLEEKKDESAKDLVALAKSQFGQSKLIALLNGDNETPAEEEAAADPGAEATPSEGDEAAEPTSDE